LRRRVPLAIAIGVGIITAAILSLVAFRGWIPHDEGTLGQAGVRIMQGQWPHADFHDVYPGLLGVIHAALFEVLGVSIAAMRWGWLALAAVASASLFWLLRQRFALFGAALGAMATTVTAWSLYPASIPTWWNLTLGMVVIALVYSGSQRERSTHILLAGLLAGVSFLVKTTGGVLIAIPVFLWLLMGTESTPLMKRVAAIGAGIAAGLLMAPVMTLSRVLFLSFPVTMAVLILLRRSPVRSQTETGRSKWHPALLFVLGSVSLPVIVALMYGLTGRWSALWRGWVSSPALRFGVAAAERDVPVNLEELLLAIVVAAAIFVGMRLGIDRRVGLIAASVGLALWGFLDWVDFGNSLFAFAIWAPVALAAFAVSRSDRFRDDLVILVVACAFFFLLVQIPLWNAYYSGYTITLTIAAVLLSVRRMANPLIFGIAIVAGVMLTHSLTGHLVGPHAVEEPIDYVYLEASRARIWVPAEDGFYNDLTARVSGLRSDSVYAGPDSPEIAFLADIPSATPDFFEVLNSEWKSEVVAEFASEGIPVVVNLGPSFSDPIPSRVLTVVQSVHDLKETYGNFEVFWSE
jgi:hypothetical protein